MISKYMKIELKKAFNNKIMMIVIAIAILITMLNVISNMTIFQQYKTELNSMKEAETIISNPTFQAFTLYGVWIGGENNTIGYSLFYFLLSIFAVMPYGWSLVDEMQSGYVKNIFVRTKKSDYYISKYLATFLTGGVVVTVPLVINFMINAMFFPALLPEIIYPYYGMIQGTMWSKLFYEHPFVFEVLYMILDFVFSGLIATMCIGFAFWIKKRVLVIFLPFLLILALDYISSIHIVKYEISFMKFLHSLQAANSVNGGYVLCVGIIIFGFSFGTCLLKGLKYEVF